MATSAGWLFHYSNGAVLPEDTDPNWAGTITVRPNESVAQFVPDTPPPDDSQLFAPPPVAVEQAASAETPVRRGHPRAAEGHRGLPPRPDRDVSFELAGLADVQLVAKRDGKAIARTAKERLKAGKHSLKLSFSAKRWPTGLSFKTKELSSSSPCRRAVVKTTRAPPAVAAARDRTRSPPSCESGSSSGSSSPGTGPNAVSTSVRR